MRAYDARYGWGTVVEKNDYHVIIRFDHEPEYTREYIKIAVEGDNTLSNRVADVVIRNRINNEILLADIVKMY